MTDRIAKRPPDSLFRLVTDQWTDPFWQAAAKRQIVVCQCKVCDELRSPPTPFCPACHSQDVHWLELSGFGSIYSYTVVSRAVMAGMEECLPYVPAIIELEGARGQRVISNIVDVPIEEIAIGKRVKVVWDLVGTVTVPRFTLD